MVSYDTNDSQAILAAVAALQKGGIVVYPTDTVYGFAVDAENPEAIAQLFNMKGRDAEKVALMAVADLKMAKRYVEVSPLAEALAAQFWPGRLSIVMPRRSDCPSPLRNTVGTIGVRMPKHSWVLQLCQEFGRAITSTSVNKSGEPALTDPREIERQFGNRIDVLIDGGICNNSPSTVVGCDASGAITIFREGAISEAEINAAIKR